MFQRMQLCCLGVITGIGSINVQNVVPVLKLLRFFSLEQLFDCSIPGPTFKKSLTDFNALQPFSIIV